MAQSRNMGPAAVMRGVVVAVAVASSSSTSTTKPSSDAPLRIQAAQLAKTVNAGTDPQRFDALRELGQSRGVQARG